MSKHQKHIITTRFIQSLKEICDFIEGNSLSNVKVLKKELTMR